MEQKHRFISLAGTGRFTLTELCADFRVSRKTGYKWVRRYQQEGLRGRSRRPRHCPHHTAEEIARLILQDRAALVAELCGWTDGDRDRQMKADAKAGKFSAVNKDAANT